MRVSVEVLGSFRTRFPQNRGKGDVEVQPGATVGDLLAALGIDANEPWNASLNGALATESDALSEGAVVLIFPPMAGGSVLVERSTQGGGQWVEG